MADDAGSSKRAEKRARQKANKAAEGGDEPAPAPAPAPKAAGKAGKENSGGQPNGTPEPKAKAKAQAKAPAEPVKEAAKPEPKGSPKAKAKAKAEAKAEPKAKAKAEAKAEPKAEPKPKAKKKKAETKDEEEAETVRQPATRIEEFTPTTIDDGSGGAWEMAAPVKKTKKKDRDDDGPKQKAIPGMGPAVPADQQAIPGMGPKKAEMTEKQKAKAVADVLKGVASRTGGGAAAGKEEQAPEKTGPTSVVTVAVPEEKIGRIIGPKGANLKAIQEKCGVSRIDTTGEMFTISGDPKGVAMAEAALNELVEKGYTSLFFENFEEDFVMVHPSAFPDLIGKQGAIIRALKEQLGAEINIPPVPKDAGKGGGKGGGKVSPALAAKKYKVSIAGSKEAVSKAKDAINDILMYYHSEITHPGEVHEEFEIQQWQLSYIIGKGGSEMRHIQSNFKCRVYVPRETSANPKTVIVGERPNVDRAKTYVEKLLWNAENAPKGREGGEKADDGWGDEEHEGWMDQYMYKRK